MSDFHVAVLTVLQHEGGYVNDPNDPGGETNFGISKRFLSGLKNQPDRDIRNLTKDEAIEIYRGHWWDKYHYALISNQAVATKVFDLSINMGAIQAHKLLQRAIMLCSNISLIIDGIFGIKTLAACNDTDPLELLKAIREQAADFYRSLNKPRFLSGWLKRAYA